MKLKSKAPYPLRIVAIDPGTTGALVAMKGQAINDWLDMPCTAGEYDVLKIRDFIDRYADVVVLEKPSANGTNGSQANFSMGLSLGTLKATVLLSEIRLEYVAPQTWKANMGLQAPKGSTDTQKKKISLAAARRLWPDHEAFKLEKHHNRADAALIAEWYRTRRQ